GRLGGGPRARASPRPMSANCPATVELLVGLRSVTGVEPLVRALGRFAVVRASDPALAPPDARVATSTDAPGLPDALHEAVPLAVALREGEEPAAELVAHVSALLVA